MELSIPGSSFDAIARIASASSRTKVVIFTGAMVIDYSVKAIEAGAVGYVIKRSSGRELEEAICAVNRGEMFITPSFAAKVIGALRSPTQQKAAEAPKLNIREEQYRASSLARVHEQGNVPSARLEREDDQVLHDRPDAKAQRAKPD